jgi:ESS family glutamate:Na+ symporter
MEIGVACATFGLVLGGIVGGPLAKRLIERFSLESSAEEARTVGVGYETEAVAIDYDAMLNTIFSVGIAVGIGIGLQYLAAGAGLQLPLFVPCLFGGILVTNIGPMILPHYHWPGGTPAMALVSDVSLGLFLAMSLMSLELWTLADLAGPIIGLLVAQVVAVVVYARFVVFPAMRKDYDAAVMAAGYVGLGLGATPTAVANMTAVTERFGAAPRAFIVIPLVGAFFIDLANALVVQFFLQRLA